MHKITPIGRTYTLTFAISSGERITMSQPHQGMPLCNHEEAVTRLPVHVRHAVESGAKAVMIRTVHPDVIVITLPRFSSLLLLQPKLQIWIAFCTGKYFQHLSVNSMYVFRNPGAEQGHGAYHLGIPRTRE